MKAELHHDKATDVAYVDVCPLLPDGVRIDVLDVTDLLDMKTQVLARIDENGQLLGLIIQNYKAFKREIRLKYLALAVEGMLDLIISRDQVLTDRSTGCHEQRRLGAHA